jgi:hypothetical protein
VKQKAAAGDFFQSRPECGQQIRREIAYESDGVINDHFLLTRKPQTAGGGIQRREHPGFGQNVARGESVEQGRFSGVGVADYRKSGNFVTEPFLSSLFATLALRCKFAFEAVNAITGAAAIGFEFRLSRAAPADTAG